jgi:CheY-like chemotaxis protein/two-component sensor histidine kinase
MVQRQVRHIVRLVDDLLEVSRITRGKIELRCAQVDLAAILRAAVETSKPMLDRGHQRLHLDLPDTALVLDADAVRLTQVFANLLHNAAKYTVECGDIWVEARRDGAEAVVSVRDTGAGIAADVLPRVFDLFAQGRDAPAASGLGIGLTMARSLVELHQGSIEARSEGPGRGSEFTVRLPLAQQPAPGQAALESAPESAPGLADAEAHAPRPDARRVLVVDDNRDAANSLALLLSAQGNEVQVAYGGQDALELLAKWMPDVAVVDIGMPGMDGCQLARRIRGDRRCAGLRLVALSGWGHAGARAQSQACGFDEHLTKPADIGVLGAILAATRGRPP